MSAPQASVLCCLQRCDTRLLLASSAHMRVLSLVKPSFSTRVSTKQPCSPSLPPAAPGSLGGARGVGPKAPRPGSEPHALRGPALYPFPPWAPLPSHCMQQGPLTRSSRVLGLRACARPPPVRPSSTGACHSLTQHRTGAPRWNDWMKKCCAGGDLQAPQGVME